MLDTKWEVAIFCSGAFCWSQSSRVPSCGLPNVSMINRFFMVGHGYMCLTECNEGIMQHMTEKSI